MTPRPGPDRGAAVVWVLACGAMLLTVAAVIVLRSAAVLARHRAESAADLAALAAAGRIGVGGRPCDAAHRLAAANAASVRRCVVELDTGGRSGTVRVEVVAVVRLPIVGSEQVVASARAGRLPG